MPTSQPPPSGDRLPFEIRRQPDDVTCGPTCLHAVYRYWGDDVPPDDLIRDVKRLDEGGTLGVLLANHALRKGYKVTIFTWNLQVFDPTWFQPGGPPLVDRLRARAKVRRASKERQAIAAYVDFVGLGGKLELAELEASLLRGFLKRGVPIMTGLSATFLYREPREVSETGAPDDIGGEPQGHFVVLTGYDADRREVLVTDPMHPNPLSVIHTYPVRIERVIGAIFLGVLTFDANLIVIEPADGRTPGTKR